MELRAIVAVLTHARHAAARLAGRLRAGPHPVPRTPNQVFYGILGTLMIPAAVTFVPSFVLVSSLGWVSTLRGLIVPGAVQAFAAFLFRQYFLGFPQELEDAARVDGLGYWRHVLADRRAQLPGGLRRGRRDHVHRRLERLPVAAGDRPGRVVLDGPGRAVHVHRPRSRWTCTNCSWRRPCRSCRWCVVFVVLQRYLVAGVERTGIDD